MPPSSRTRGGQISASEAGVERNARKRGGQPGNSNALRHGFYSRSFRSIDLTDLDAVRATLDDEIAAARVMARRIFEQATQYTDQTPDADPIASIHAFAMFGSQVVKIAHLLRTQHILTGSASGDDTQEAITKALAAIGKEWKTL